ncbi:MAG: Si-specific NAD(P)(+) transhydrogenase [Chloroflexi bacterium]|nr:Si-specific NAD(P)(+) transhydrogenase [Chloroflexota bacterium]
MSGYDYDMVVIGSGPAGQRAAVQAAQIGKRVAVVERLPHIGGLNVTTGTASKALREAALHLSGFRERTLYGESYTVKQNITMNDLMVSTNHVMHQQAEVLRSQLARNWVDMFHAEASFADRHTINLNEDDDEAPERMITTDKVIIAVGTYSTQPPTIHTDGRLIFLSDDVMDLPELPRVLTVVGGGAIGLEYASTFAALGVRVTLVDRSPRLLPFADDEIVDTLVYHLRQHDVTFRLSEDVFDIEYLPGERGNHVRVLLKSGKQIMSDAVMYCVGRTGATGELNLDAAGLETDDRGRISVDENYQTSVEGVYAVGGVIGFPDLVSTSQMQGRLAACHAFDVPANSVPGLFPYAVKTTPEIAMVGKTESQLTDEGIPYEVGKAQYREIAKSVIEGDESGILKLLFHIDTRKLLGVHIAGEGAAELVQIGQAVIAHGGRVDYFVEAVTSFPTLAEAYVAAALDGLQRIEV